MRSIDALQIGQVINDPSIKIWWNGTSVPANNIKHLGGGLFSVALTPITVAPGDDPILLNMTISASGYQDKYYEMYLAVDPDIVKSPTSTTNQPLLNTGNDDDDDDEEDDNVLLIVATVSAISALGAVVVISAILIKTRLRLKREN